MFQFMMLMDPLYLLITVVSLALAGWAQWKVKSAYHTYSRMPNGRGLSGAEAAAAVLRQEGVDNVKIEPTRGWLSDHYDPRSKTLRLSPDVYGGRSVAAVGIAAHEAGHALQDAQGYALLGLRSSIVPVAGLGSWLAFPIIFIGALFSAMSWIYAGIILFGAVVAFQFVTLPVEYDASSRAKDALVRTGVIGRSDEIEGVNRVLDAAALTYVAATVSALLQLLYLLLRFGGSDD